MPGPYPFGETVRILRTGASPGRDDRGHPLPGVDESFDVPGCVVTPRESSPQVGGSEQQGRDTVVVGWTVYAPAGTAIRTTDRAQVRGVVCEITGEPGVPRSLDPVTLFSSRRTG